MIQMYIENKPDLPPTSPRGGKWSRPTRPLAGIKAGRVHLCLVANITLCDVPKL